jgi:hypothetical protein
MKSLLDTTTLITALTTTPTLVAQAALAAAGAAATPQNAALRELVFEGRQVLQILMVWSQ